MQGFRKLALVTAITTALPVASFAMQSMSDSQMSGISGQDGLTLSIKLPATVPLNVTLYDRDGIGANATVNGLNTGLTTNSAGAVILQGMQVSTTSNIQELIDAGQSGSNKPVLNISVSIPSGTTINTGSLYLADTSTTVGSWGVTNQTATAVLQPATIALGASTINVQLGNVAQSMNVGASTVNPAIAINTVMMGGLTINNFALADNSATKIGGVNTSASLKADKIWLVDDNAGAPGVNLTGASIGVDVATNGLALGIGSLGSATGVDEYLTNVKLGDANPVGDLAITGLNLNGSTMLLAGHGAGGLTATLNLPTLSYNETIYDRNGIGASATVNGLATGLTVNGAGAIVLQGAQVITGAGGLVLTADAGANGIAPVLNLSVSIPAGTTINTGSMYLATTVAGSSPRINTDWAVSNKMASPVLNSMTINLGASTLNIQLGNVAQSMNVGASTVNPAIAINTVMTGGLTINNFALADNAATKIGGVNTSASLTADKVWLVDDSAGAPGVNLTSQGAAGKAGIGINVTSGGLALGIGSLGSATGVDEFLTNVKLGNAVAMGDLAVTGLILNGGRLLLAGHAGGGVTESLYLPTLTFNQAIYDRDGINNPAATGITAGAAGAVVIQGMSISTGANPLVLTADAGAKGTSPVLNLSITIPNATTVTTGSLYVGTTTTGSSPRVAGDWVVSNQVGPIMSSSTMTLGASTMNIQLGNVPQTMTVGAATVNPSIAINTQINGGLKLNNFTLNDTGGVANSGSISATQIWLVDNTSSGAAGANLTSQGSAGQGGLGVNVTSNGLVLGVGSLGSGYGVNEYVQGLAIGGGPAMGNMVVQGLQLNGVTVTIAGH